VENTKFTKCRLDNGVRFLSATRQAFEEMEDDSSSSSSSFSNSSISSGSSLDMSDDDDNDEWSDDDDISDGELSFAFSFAFDKASTNANKLNQPIEHQEGIQWRRKHGLKIVELSSDDGLTFFR
jgi:U3 small nucleolar RNA-associated protein 14